jgi:hypothetical protein
MGEGPNIGYGKRKPSKKSLWFLLLLLLIGISAECEVTLPALLADHMVIQRDRPIHFWGKAKPYRQ